MFLNFFLIPLLTTIFFIFVLYPCAFKIGLTDKPSHRKQHQKQTPLIGGIAIYFAVLVTLLFFNSPFSNQIAYISAATLLVFIGLIDDYKDVSFKIRLVIQIASALIMVEFAHIKIIDLGDLLGFGHIYLGNYATIFTVFAVVGVINAFNMIDGIDGLAGSLILVSIVSIADVAWIAQNWELFKFCLIFIAAILAFLLFNLRIFGRPSAKIFMGDTGSTLLGFTICWLLISSSQGEKALIMPATALWIIALPLLDSVCIMFRRLKKRRSPFNPDREHLHHIFTVSGYSVNQTVTMLLTFSLGLSFTGITASLFFKVSESLLFAFFIILFFCYYWLVDHAWMIMKISRYLRVTTVFDRRVRNQTVDVNTRSETDRRFIPSNQQLEKFHKYKGAFIFLLKNESETRQTKDSETKDS
jgi:UDP-GlcNAc:undecaprenyl-phosphate/decaprenyl-phosphate GlcNAc-1-phosphate transferase